jgi:hypothetical protein
MGCDGGLLMQGTWFNRATGDSFTVQDMYFEDNNPRVKTTDGRVLDYKIVQNYIQVDPKDLAMLKQQIVATKAPEKPQTKINIGNIGTASDLSDYSDILGDDPLFQNNPVSVQCTNPYVEKKSPNAAMIDKALKHQSIPEMTPSFEWNNFPKKQLDALVDVMEVPTDEIVDYVYNEMMEVIGEELKKQVKEYIVAKINAK